VVGVPCPRVFEGMRGEHTAKEDANKEFTTSNYEVTTTSAIEWKFVTEPDAVIDWPKEQKGAMRRAPMPLSELQSEMEERNKRLREMKEPVLMLDEALGARLYTGPLFVKYNKVLRSVDSDPELSGR